MDPYESKNLKFPNFISMVLSYIDGLDLGRYLDFNDASEFEFVLTSFTNSLKRFLLNLNIRIVIKFWKPLNFR